MRETLAALAPGQHGEVLAVTAPPGLQEKLRGFGLVPGTRVACLQRSPLGDPTAYWIRGAAIALRREQAQYVEIAGIE